MKKIFLLMLTTLFSLAISAEVKLDFTNATTEWGIPSGTGNTSNLHDETEFTNGTYTISIAAPSTSGNGFYFNTGGYLMLCQTGAYIKLPTVDFAVGKIVVEGHSNASSSTKQNIYVGDVAVSTETTGSATTNTYEIASDYQAVGTQYTFMVGSNHNAQVCSITIYGVDEEVGSDTPTGHGYEPDDPYSVAELIPIISALPSGGTISNLYVSGTISQITEVSPSYGNMTYYISDDGTTSNQLLIYRGKSLNNAAPSSEDEIQVGDAVIVAGTFVNYSGNTPEGQTGNTYIYSLEREEPAVESGIELTPSDGAILQSLSSIIVKCADGIELQTYPSDVKVWQGSKNITVGDDDDWDEIVESGKVVGYEIKLVTPVTAEGDYTYTIEAGAFTYGADEEENDYITVNFTIGSTEEPGGEATITLNPADNDTVGHLETIIITCEEGSLLEEFDKVSDVKVYNESKEVVASGADIDDNYDWNTDKATEFTLTLDTKITAAGTYYLYVPDGLLYYPNDGNPKDYPGFTATYFVDGSEEPAVESGIELTPSDGAILQSLSSIIVKCADGIELQTYPSDIKVWQGSKNITVGDDDDWDEIVESGKVVGYEIKLVTPVTAEGDYTYTIEAGAFTYGADEEENDYITVNFTIGSDQGGEENLFTLIQPESNVIELAQIEEDYTVIVKCSKEDAYLTYTINDVDPATGTSEYVRSGTFTYESANDYYVWQNPLAITLTEGHEYTFTVKAASSSSSQTATVYGEELLITFIGTSEAYVYADAEFESISPNTDTVLTELADTEFTLTFTGDVKIDGDNSYINFGVSMHPSFENIVSSDGAEYSKVWILTVSQSTLSMLTGDAQGQDLYLVVVAEDAEGHRVNGNGDGKDAEGLSWLNFTYETNFSDASGGATITLNPADNDTVGHLETIIITCEEGSLLEEFNKVSDVKVYNESKEVVASGADIDDNYDWNTDKATEFTLTLDTKITAEGTYYLYVPDGLLYYPNDGDPIDYPGFTATYFVDGSEDISFEELLVDNNYEVSNAGTYYYTYTPTEDGKLTVTGSAQMFGYHDEELTHELFSTYESGYGYRDDMTYFYLAAGVTYYFKIDLKEEGNFIAEYTFDDPSYTFKPVDGSTVKTLTAITVGYEGNGLNFYAGTGAYVSFKVFNDATDENVSGPDTSKWSTYDNGDGTATIYLANEITEAGSYTAYFPENMFKDMVTGEYLGHTRVHYTVDPNAPLDTETYEKICADISNLTDKLESVWELAEDEYYTDEEVGDMYKEISAEIASLQSSLDLEYNAGETLDYDTYAAQVAVIDAEIDHMADVSYSWYIYYGYARRITNLLGTFEVVEYDLEDLGTDVYNAFIDEYNSLYDDFMTWRSDLLAEAEAGELNDDNEATIVEMVNYFGDSLDNLVARAESYEYYLQTKSSISDLNTSLDETWTKIGEEYPSAVEPLTEDYYDIVDQLEDLDNSVDMTYEDGELGDYKDAVESQIAAIEAAIEQLLEDAKGYIATGINGIEVDYSGMDVYTLGGQKVNAPTKGGIYIINGKKVYIKK